MVFKKVQGELMVNMLAWQTTTPKKNGRFVNSTFEREVQLSCDPGSFGGSLYS